MERLNDIISRTAQRRQQESDHQSTVHTPSQGMRPGAAPPRRPLPEQTARLGQPAGRGQAQGPHSHPEPPLVPTRVGGQSDLNPYAARPAYNQQRAQANRPMGRGQPQGPHNHPEPPLVPTPGAWSPGRSMPSTHADTHHPGVQADVRDGGRDGVQDEWEDDTANIRYGDWENDAYDERMRPPGSDHKDAINRVPGVNRAAARIAQTYNGSRSMVTRELHSLSEEEASLPMPMARNGRDGRMPAPLPSHPSLPPAPLATPQEVRQTHRATQPLNRSAAIVRMSQDMSPDQSRLQPNRQMVVRQQTTLYPPTSGPCTICKGAGYLRADVPFGDPSFGKPIACKCKEAERKQKRRQQLEQMSDLGAFYNKSFESFNPRVPGVQEAYKVANKFARDPDGWLLFIGPNGCGKTHLAAAIANQSLDDGALVLFATVPDLLDHLRAAFAPTATEVYDKLFARMREAEVLVLDDLGAHQSSPWANEKLFQLLNYRYNSRFPTVITANLKGLQAIDERIYSRIMDTSLVTKVVFDHAGDYRLNKSR